MEFGFPYKTRQIQFEDRTALIILHGSTHRAHSPLIAICNILSLKNRLGLDLNTNWIAKNELLALVAAQIHAANPAIENEPDVLREERERKIAEAIDMLPTLDDCRVDIRFRWIYDFGDFPERVIFRLLKIPMYHGRIVNPKEAIGEMTLVELQAMGGQLFQPFVDLLQHKMVTAYGLGQLDQVLEVDERNRDTFCTFVINNDFLVMCKMNKVLKTLMAAEVYSSLHDEEMWCVPGNAYHEKWLLKREILHLTGGETKQLVLEILIIGSDEFGDSVMTLINALRENYEVIRFKHAMVIDDAWTAIITTDFHLIVIDNENEYENLCTTSQELGFRGSALFSKDILSESEILRKLLDGTVLSFSRSDYRAQYLWGMNVNGNDPAAADLGGNDPVAAAEI